MGTYHRTAGSKSEKRLHNQHIDGIHQRYRRDCRRSQIADYKGIHTSHKRIQELIQSQRDQKSGKFSIIKQKRLCSILHDISSFIVQ